MSRHAAVRVASPHIWHDLPPIPDRFDFAWKMEVLPEGEVARACSDALVEHGMWEPAQTLAMLLAFEQFPRHQFVDFGANVGYYSALALSFGLPVLAIDHDPELHEILRRNLEGHSYAWLHDVDGSHVPDLPPQRVIVKIDLEGADYLALRSLAGYLSQVDVVMIELSPVFNDSWRDAVNLLYSMGMVGALIPVKSDPPPKFESFADLDWRHTPEQFRELMKGADQRDALFVRPEEVEL